MLPKGRVGTIVAALIAAACLAVGGAAFAQEAQERGAPGGARQSTPEAAKSADDFSEEELQAFAEVQTEIQDIGQRYQSKVANAEGSSEMQKLQQDMQKEMVEVVQSSDLDVGTYNSIAKAARGDPELQEKIKGLE